MSTSKATTRFPSGLNIVSKGSPMSDCPLPDNFHASNRSTSAGNLCITSYAEDFVSYISPTYAVTGAGSTFSMGTDLGGIYVLAPGGATVASAAYLYEQSFKVIAGQRTWYQTRCTCTGLGGTVQIGLQSGGTSANEALFFTVDAAGAVGVSSVTGGVTTVLLSGIANMIAGTYISLAFEFDGSDLKVFVNNVLTARVVAPVLSPAFQGPFFQITPTASQILNVDYVQVAMEVIR